MRERSVCSASPTTGGLIRIALVTIVAFGNASCGGGTTTTATSPTASLPDNRADAAHGEGPVAGELDASDDMARASSGGDEPSGDPGDAQPAPSTLPVVQAGVAKVESSIDKDDIRDGIRSRLRQIRACYEQGLLNDPNLSGRVFVQFTIDSTGAVSAAELVDNGLTPEVGRCVVEEIQRLSFPPPRGGGTVVVKYPFIFTSATGDTGAAP